MGWQIAFCCCYLNKGQAGSQVGELNNLTVVPLDTRRVQKADEDLRDQESTGRKRAVADFPVPTVEEGGMLCEWAGLAYAGGGAVPIVGCDGKKIAKTKQPVDGFLPGNVHHGPDKSTINNEQGNVHRVCPFCHNRWHSLNDPLYGDRPASGMPFIPLSGDNAPHDTDTEATEAEMKWSEEYWALPAKTRTRIPYRLKKD